MTIILENHSEYLEHLNELRKTPEPDGSLHVTNCTFKYCPSTSELTADKSRTVGNLKKIIYDCIFEENLIFDREIPNLLKFTYTKTTPHRTIDHKNKYIGDTWYLHTSVADFCFFKKFIDSLTQQKSVFSDVLGDKASFYLDIKCNEIRTDSYKKADLGDFLKHFHTYDFHNAQIKATNDTKSIFFPGNSHIRNANFYNITNIGGPYDAHHGESYLQFTNCSFGADKEKELKLSISKATYENNRLEMTNCRSSVEIIISRSRVFRINARNCSFRAPLNFFKNITSLDKLSNFSACSFDGFNYPDAEICYRDLKNKFQEIDSSKMVQEFTACELGAHYYNLKKQLHDIASLSDKYIKPLTKNKQAHWFKKRVIFHFEQLKRFFYNFFVVYDKHCRSMRIELFGSKFLKVLSDYGRNLWLPLFWIIIGFLAIGTLFAVTGAIGCTENDCAQTALWVENAFPITRGYIHAFGYSFGPLGLLNHATGLEPKNTLVQLASFGLGIYSAVLWTIFIRNILRKYKM